MRPIMTALLLSSGCALAPSKAFSPAPERPGAAAVYFYRPSEMTGRLISPTLSANDAALGKLPNASYAVAYLPPGETQLRSQWPGIPGTRRDDSVAFTVDAGKSYYFRVRYQTTKAHDVSPSVSSIGALSFENRQGLEAVAESEALPQIGGLALAEKFGAP